MQVLPDIRAARSRFQELLECRDLFAVTCLETFGVVNDDARVQIRLEGLLNIMLASLVGVLLGLVSA